MQDEYAGGASLEALEALVRAKMETDPSLGGGGDLLDTGVHGLPALAAEPVIMVPCEDAAPGAAARGVSPQRLWMDLASPSGPVPMSLAGVSPPWRPRVTSFATFVVHPRKPRLLVKMVRACVPVHDASGFDAQHARCRSHVAGVTMALPAPIADTHLTLRREHDAV